MILIDIVCPRDALADADRSMIADDVLSGLVGTGAGSAEEVPEETMRRVRTMAHLGFRELRAGLPETGRGVHRWRRRRG